jgi:hypothetical protein
MIRERTIEALREWWLAHHFAEENPRLLIESPGQATSDLCAKRMNRCGAADKALFDVGGEVPPILMLFMEADKDKGCSACWLSSGPCKHSECKEKIARWFGYREALMAYVHEVYIRFQVEVKE